MALVNKRITELPERSALNLDDFTVVDGDTGGTAKYNLSNMDDDIGNLKTAITTKPDIKDSTATGVDLDVSDQSGNVLLRLQNGHIKTKEFDSSDVASDIEDIQTDIGDLAELDTTDKTNLVAAINEAAQTGGGGGGSGNIDVKNSTASGIDLDVSDARGDVILRLKDGGIKTKWFSSENVDGAIDYNSDFAYSGSSGKETITAPFRAGDRIVLHLADANDRITDRIASYTVTYSYTDTSNVEHTIAVDYGYHYVDYTLPVDAVAVSVSYGTGLLWNESGTLRFSVYKKGLVDRQPHIIKVAADGYGDFTSIRDAVDSITDNNAYNKYLIEIYPGTYEILSDYTATEIAETGFKGLFIGDGVYLKGIGQRDDIILHGTLDTTTYDSTKRNDVSVINIAGNSGLENLTINAENMRYCVHDDTGPMPHQEAIKEIVNCVFNATTMTTRDIAYGCGISNRRKLHFKNCIFNQELHVHTHNDGTYSPEVVIEDCEGVIFSFADYNSTVDADYRLHNCKFSMIIAECSYAPHDQYLFVKQIGGTDPIIDCESGQIYELSNCIAVRGSVSAGQLVNVNRGSSRMALTAVTSKEIASGVSIGVIGTDTIVASGGYINSNQVGLSNLSAGEYITINSSGKLVGGGTSSNAVGVVKGISARQNGGAYIKLFI